MNAESIGCPDRLTTSPNDFWTGIPYRASHEELASLCSDTTLPHSFRQLVHVVQSMQHSVAQCYSGEKTAVESLRRDLTQGRVVIKEAIKQIVSERKSKTATIYNT